jgi:transposase
MINVPTGARVLLATRPVDFRKGAHGLAALAQEVLAADPFSGAVIVYRAKRGDRVKILVWDTSGLVLIWKRLNSRRCLMASTGRVCRRHRGFQPRPLRLRIRW